MLPQLQSRHTNRTEIHCTCLEAGNREREDRARPQPSSRNWLRVLSRVNVNFCVQSVAGLKDSAYVSGKIESLNPSPVIARKKDLTSKSETVNSHVNSCVVNHVPSVTGLQQKKGVIPNYCQNYTEIKYVKDVSCVGHLSSVNLRNCCSSSTCRGQIAPVLGKVGSPGVQPQGCNSTQVRLHPPLPVLAQLDQVTHSHKLLCKSQQEPLLVGGIASASEKKCSGTGTHSEISRFLQQTIAGAQTQQPVETHLGPEHLEHIPKHRVIQNGDTRDNKNLPTGRGVGYLHRFHRHILPHTNSQSVQEVHALSRPGSVLPVQSTTLWPVHSTHRVHSGG